MNTNLGTHCRARSFSFDHPSLRRHEQAQPQPGEPPDLSPLVSTEPFEEKNGYGPAFLGSTPRFIASDSDSGENKSGRPVRGCPVTKEHPVSLVSPAVTQVTPSDLRSPSHGNEWY